MKGKCARKGLCLILAGAMVASSMYCSDNAFAAKKATLKTKSIKMYKGDTAAIKIKNKKFSYTFKSNKTSIAKVNKKGKVTAVKKGNANITVKEVIKGKKARKLGVCRVYVNNRTIKVTDAPAASPTTQVTVSTTGAAPTSAVTASPVVTQAPAATDTPAPTDTPEPRETLAPAYDTLKFDFNESAGDFSGVTLKDGKDGKAAAVTGHTLISLDKFMQYGGILKVGGSFKQDSGEAKDITVSYTGKYLSFKQNGAYIDKGSMNPDDDMSGTVTASCPSGEWTDLEFELNVNKYSKDLDVSIAIQGNGEFMIDDLVIEGEPCKRADYRSMVTNSVRSTGNNARIKKFIDKAKNGEPVTMAYLGGSITEGFAASETNNSDCYAETSYRLFTERFAPGDGSNVKFINAGMSGTPSSLGIVRYERDIINMNDGKPADILFIDFAVNDGSGDAVYYENLIRYALEQGTAVVLMFVMYSKGNGNEKGYAPIGENYDLAMVSPASGMKNCDKTSYDNWFYWSDGHPDVGGHRYMADCIFEMLDRIDGEGAEEDNITDIAGMPMYTKNAAANYVGMKTIESATKVGGSLLEFDKGSFDTHDTNQTTLQYAKYGKEGGAPDNYWFPNDCSCPADKYEKPYKAKIRCNSILVSYHANTHGTAEVYLDGNLVKTLNNTNAGWACSTTESILNSSEVAEHELEIRIPDSAKGNRFTIYAVGYSDQEAFRAK